MSWSSYDHVCESFIVAHDHTMCSECGKISGCIYDTTANNVVEWQTQDSHVCMLGENHEFFKNQSYTSSIQMRYNDKKSAPFTYINRTSSLSSYKDKVLSVNFRIIESIILIMQVNSNIERDTKRYMCRVVRESTIKSNTIRYMCNFVCLFIAMRKYGIILNFDDIIAKFGLDAKLAIDASRQCIMSFSNEYIPHLSDSEFITLYLRRINMDFDLNIHATALRQIDAINYRFGRIYPILNKTRIAVVAALVLCRVENPYQYTKAMFMTKLFNGRSIVNSLPEVKEHLQSIAEQKKLAQANKSSK